LFPADRFVITPLINVVFQITPFFLLRFFESQTN